MRELAGQIREWTAAGKPVALATVVEVIRSAPRPPGSKLAVSGDGEIAGAVSGGCVEGAVVAAARELLDGDGPPRLLRFGIDDEEALGVGLPCGGEIDVLVERVEGAELEAFLAAGAEGGTAALVSALPDPGGGVFVAGSGAAGAPDAAGGSSGPAGRSPNVAPPRGRGDVPAGGKLLLDAGTLHGTLGSPALTDAGAALAAGRLAAVGTGGGRPGPVMVVGDRRLFCDVAVPPPRLLIFGAVDYAAALCELAAGAGWRSFVIDPRRAFAAPERFAAAERVLVAWPREAIAELGGIDAATAVVVLTHDPKLDDEALAAALESPARYIGAMGSRISSERRAERLREAGFDAGQLARIAAPIGLDLGAATPAETALSIFAEIVALANGRDGGRLASGSGPIHAVA